MSEDKLWRIVWFVEGKSYTIGEGLDRRYNDGPARIIGHVYELSDAEGIIEAHNREATQ